jgi:hypothetical protein
MEKVSIIGLDLAKNVFQAHGACSDGSVVFRMKISRVKLLAFFASVPKCLVAMEACGAAHHWARQIVALGHEVRLIAPIYVKPFVKRNKNDAADAEAIAEAASRPTMRFVAVKSMEKQASGMAFKTRDLLVRQRTQAINALPLLSQKVAGHLRWESTMRWDSVISRRDAGMNLRSADNSRSRFAAYVEGLVSVIGHTDRAGPLRDYCLGLIMPCERKSVEPMAAVTAPDRTAAQHQSLLHFVGQSP